MNVHPDLAPLAARLVELWRAWQRAPEPPLDLATLLGSGARPGLGDWGEWTLAGGSAGPLSLRLSRAELELPAGLRPAGLRLTAAAGDTLGAELALELAGTLRARYLLAGAAPAGPATAAGTYQRGLEHGLAAALGDPDLDLAAWYRDGALTGSSNGQTLVGMYYFHQPTIQALLTDTANPYHANLATSLAEQKDTRTAVSTATGYYRQHGDVAGAPTIGSSDQYAGGFTVQGYLAMAAQAARDDPHASAAEKAEQQDLLDAMAHFYQSVAWVQNTYPGERSTAEILRYVASADPDSIRAGAAGMPIRDPASGEVLEVVRPGRLDRGRYRAALAARGLERPDLAPLAGTVTWTCRGRLHGRLRLRPGRARPEAVWEPHGLTLAPPEVSLEGPAPSGAGASALARAGRFLRHSPAFRDLLRLTLLRVLGGSRASVRLAGRLAANLNPPRRVP